MRFAKLLVPPLFLNAAKWFYYTCLKVAGVDRFVDYEYIKDGWSYVNSHAEVRGWNVEEILGVQKKRWQKFKKSVEATGTLGLSNEFDVTQSIDLAQHNTLVSFGYVVALAARNKKKLSILDWGGGIGHYYVLAKSLVPNVEIEYHCKEVPALAQYGSELFPKQRFYSDDTCLDRTYDLVVASASLHYTEKWEGLLSSLARAAECYLFVTRLPTVLRTSSFVFLQRPYAFGYDTEYLGWCINRDHFLAEAKTMGLVLFREFLVAEQPYIFRAPEQCIYRGFLFRPETDHSNHTGTIQSSLQGLE